MTEERGHVRGKKKSIIQSVLVNRLLLKAPGAQSYPDLWKMVRTSLRVVPLRGKEAVVSIYQLQPTTSRASTLEHLWPACVDTKNTAASTDALR